MNGEVVPRTHNSRTDGESRVVLLPQLRHTLRQRGGVATRNNNMARKPGTRTVGEFVLFDVEYEDGTQRSNRRVPASVLGGLDGDEPAKAVIAEQDAEIAEKSGQPRGPIKSVRRAGAKAVDPERPYKQKDRVPAR
jgi:hypothetical protein